MQLPQTKDLSSIEEQPNNSNGRGMLIASRSRERESFLENRRKKLLSTYKIREPLAALAEEEQKRNHSSIMRMIKLPTLQTTPKSTQPVDLKSILKHSGGTSLVEILQQKNISLEDLLKGKQNALLALQPTITTASNDVPTSSIKYIKTDKDTMTTSSEHPLTFITAGELSSSSINDTSDDKVVVPTETTSKPEDNTSLRKKIMLPKLTKRGPMMKSKASNSTTMKDTSEAATTTTTMKIYSVVTNRFAIRPKEKHDSSISGGF